MKFTEIISKVKEYLFSPRIEENTTTTLNDEWEEKRIILEQMVTASPEFLRYMNDVVKNNSASDLVGLPERSVTEVYDDFFTGDKIIRFKRK
jgi:hypothetical protein